MKVRVTEKAIREALVRVSLAATEEKQERSPVQTLADTILECFVGAHNEHVRRVIEALGEVLGVDTLRHLPKGHFTGAGDFPTDFSFVRVTNKSNANNYKLNTLVLVLFSGHGIGELDKEKENTFRVGNLLSFSNVAKVTEITEEVKEFIQRLKDGWDETFCDIYEDELDSCVDDGYLEEVETPVTETKA